MPARDENPYAAPNVPMFNAVYVPVREGIFLCNIAAALWISVKVSLPAVIPFAAHP